MTDSAAFHFWQHWTQLQAHFKKIAFGWFSGTSLLKTSNKWRTYTFNTFYTVINTTVESVTQSPTLHKQHWLHAGARYQTATTAKFLTKRMSVNVGCSHHIRLRGSVRYLSPRNSPPNVNLTRVNKPGAPFKFFNCRDVVRRYVKSKPTLRLSFKTSPKISRM